MLAVESGSGSNRRFLANGSLKSLPKFDIVEALKRTVSGSEVVLPKTLAITRYTKLS